MEKYKLVKFDCKTACWEAGKDMRKEQLHRWEDSMTSLTAMLQSEATATYQIGLSKTNVSCETYSLPDMRDVIHIHLIRPQVLSLPRWKALAITPCLLHVDMENILGWNSNDSNIHSVSQCAVFVFKLLFFPNRVYKPCLVREDLILPYSLDSNTLGQDCTGPQRRSCRIFMDYYQTGTLSLV